MRSASDGVRRVAETIEDATVSYGGSAPVMGRMRSARLRVAASPRPIIVAAAVIFGLHVAASLVLSQHAGVTLLGLGCSYALASHAALRHARRSAWTLGARWRLVSLGMAVGAVGSFVLLYGESRLIATHLAVIQDAMLLLRGIPFLIAVSLSRRERSPVFVRLDLLQAMLAVCLACIALLYAFPGTQGGRFPLSNPMGLDRIVVANLLLAVATTARLLGTYESEERRFFRQVGIFLWTNTLLQVFLNLVVVQRWGVPAGSVLLAAGDLPVLGLAVACSLRRSGRKEFTGARADGIFADTASSFIFPFGMFLMAASIVPNHFYLGMACVTVTFLLYGVRSTVVQTRYLEVLEDLRLANDRSQDQALLDALTEIPNRRSFDLTLDREWKRGQRSGQPLALLLIDIDHFKRLNDTYGHPVGDVCLKEIAGLLRAGLGRQGDFAARWGGEEFAVLLVDTGLEGARTVAELLRRSVERHRFMESEGTTVTVSVGVAVFVPTLQEPPSSLVVAADKELYRAKRSGRNRVETQAT